MGAAGTWLKAVLVACSALEGFEGVREAVPEHGHLAAMAHRAGHEGKAATRPACVGVLYPLWSKTHVIERKEACGVFYWGETGAGFLCESLSHTSALYDS